MQITMRMRKTTGRNPEPVMTRRCPIRFVLVMILSGIAFGPALVAQDRADALALYRQGRYQDAVNVTLQELEENPANLDSYTVLGWSLLALDRLDDVVAYANRGLRVSRFDHRIIHILGEAHYRRGDYRESLQFLQDYAALAPAGRQIDQIYYLMGEIFIQFEEYNHADIALTKAVHLNESRAAWWGRLGYAREMAGATRSAVSAYREALQRNPNLQDARAALNRLEAEPTG